MSTDPYNEKLALTVTNQEGLDETYTIKTKEGTSPVVKTPMDLTGCTFKAQVKKTRAITATPILTLTVTVVGDPVDGQVRIQSPENLAEALALGKYFWDFNVKVGSSEPDCLWIAPYEVVAGVSKWT